MHTARRTGASVGQRLDDDVALRGDLAPQINRRWFGEGGLAQPERRDSPRFEQDGDPVQEDVAAGLGDVEQPDGQVFE